MKNNLYNPVLKCCKKHNSIISLLLLVLLFPVFALAQNLSSEKTNKPLIVFHVDMNSVSLREDYLRKWLLKASQMGYNAVLWEVEDKIKWETCPECVNPEAFSKPQFKKILRYADSLGLEPIPLLQTIGHAEYVLKHKKYFSFREDTSRYDCYCTSNPKVSEFLKKWIAEYLELFGNVKYFHLGGDEAYVFGTCPACTILAGIKWKGKLYSSYENDLAEALIEKGIRPGLWSDMLLHYTEGFKGLAKQFVIWDWNYWDGSSTPSKVMVWSKGGRLGKSEITADIEKEFPQIYDSKKELRAFYTSDYIKEKGFEVILSSSSRSHGDAVFAGLHSVHSSNIIGAAKKAADDNLLGTCVTSWAVRIANYETQEPWLYLAPLAVKNSKLTDEELLKRSYEYTFGCKDKKFSEAFSLLGFSFPFSNEKTTGIMWTGMKDSRPASKEYLKDQIKQWKQKDNGQKWNNNKLLIEKAAEKIINGISLLNELIPKSKIGFESLNAWSRAGYFQYWQAVLANSIIQKEENSISVNASEMRQLIINLRAEYLQWAASWMNPSSADINTGLIYDAIFNYFENNK